MGLTHLALQKADSRDKPYKLTDGGGLYVLVAASGTKLWRYDYRLAGRRKTMAFGQWPKVSIAAARQLRDEAKDHLDAGRDPARPDAAPAAETFEQLARDWYASREAGWVSSYSERIMARLEADIFPHIGELPVTEIEPPVLLAAVRQIENRGAIELAKRVKNYCGEIFRFGIAEGRCVRDPSQDIRSALKKKPRTVHRAALRMSQMPAFVSAVEAHRDDTLAVLALRLTLSTVLRTQEIRFARWEEFEGNLWRIPGERMKERLEHLVPLPQQAMAILAEIPRSGPLLFASDTRSGVISENAMLNVVYRSGFASKMTVHGIRRTFSTAANESLLFSEDVIERTLAHVEGNEVRRAYNAAEYLDERRRLLQWWNDQLWPSPVDEYEALLG